MVVELLSACQDCLTLEEGNDWLFRNVGKNYHSTMCKISEERRTQCLSLFTAVASQNLVINRAQWIKLYNKITTGTIKSTQERKSGYKFSVSKKNAHRCHNVIHLQSLSRIMWYNSKFGRPLNSWIIFYILKNEFYLQLVKMMIMTSVEFQ
jgi:hypothetical protein